MWKSLLLGLLVSLHTRIFLVFMRNYEAKSPLFMIKRTGLNYVPRQSYSKNSHGSYILKWILVTNICHCNPANPLQLFEDFKENIIEDFVQQGNSVEKSLKLYFNDIRK